RLATAHIADMLHHYGLGLGLKNARKHIGWYLISSGRPDAVVKAWRRRLCTEDDASKVLDGLAQFYTEPESIAA
ncbi:MAG: tRNA dihydrouridine synthase DusB, partial [Hyphomicrobium sp.]